MWPLIFRCDDNVRRHCLQCIPAIDYNVSPRMLFAQCHPPACPGDLKLCNLETP
jgi:hypothetical protein